MLKSPFAASCLALFAATIGWRARNSNAPASITTTPSQLTSLVVATSAIMLISFHILGTIKIGIQHMLGTTLHLHSTTRRLGLLERWYIAHSRAGHHTGFSLALQLSSSSDDAPTLDQVRKIVRNVSRKFPFLRISVCRDGVPGVDSRERLDAVTSNDDRHAHVWGDDLSLRVDNHESIEHCHVRQEIIHDDNDFEMANGLCHVLEHEGQTPWHDEDPTECLWRAVLVTHVNNPTTFYIVVSFHHLLTDGMGAIAVVQEIVKECSSRTNLDASTNNEEHDELPPPMEDVLDTVPRLSHLLLPVLLDRFPSLTRLLKPPHFQGMPHDDDAVSPAERRSNMVCLSLLDEIQASTLRDVCRNKQHPTTVNSICVAALCRAISKHVADEQFADLYKTSPGLLLDNGQGVLLKIITAVNERPDCGRTNQDLGVYLVGPQVFVKASSKTSLEEIASLYQAKLLSARQSARMDIGLCAFIQDDWIEFAKKHANRPPNGREDSIEVSNLGHESLDTSCGDGWNVKGLWFAQGRNVTGPALTFTMVSSVGGLKAVLSAVPQTFTRASLVAIGKELEADLITLVDKDAEYNYCVP